MSSAGAGGALDRAIEAVVDVLTASTTVPRRTAVVVDRGDLLALQGSLAILQNRLVRGEVDGFVWTSVSPPSLFVKELGVPPVLIYTLLSCVVTQACLAASRSRDETIRLVERLRRSAGLVADAPVPHDHSAAIRPLWAGKVGFDTAGALRPVVVVVDDDWAFLEAAKRRLGTLCDVETFESFDDCLIHTGSMIHTIDLFLIDLVERDGRRGIAEGGVNGPALTGLDEVLPKLRRERGLRDFPQLYALSALPAAKAGHIALRLGADYYLDKTLFLAHPDPASLLGGLLWHTTHGLRALRTLGLPDHHEDWPGWASLESDAGDVRSTETKGMAWSLFAAHHRLTQIDLIERLSGGLSGAMVLSVQPRLADGSGVGEGQGRAMAPRVVKRDRWRKMAREWSAYRAHIAPLTTSGFARVEPFFWRDERDAMISYTLAGSSKGFVLGQIVSLARRMSSEKEQVPAIVRRIFTELLEPLHASAASPVSIAQLVRFMATELKPVDVSWSDGDERGEADRAVECDIVASDVVDGGSVLRVEYLPLPDYFPVAAADVQIPANSHWLARPGKRMRLGRPARLLVPPGRAFRQLVDAASQTGSIQTSPELLELFMKGLDSLDEPGQAVAKCEETVRAALQLDQPVSCWSVVHGDLNIENVLCDEGSGEFWAIDFAKTGFGPPAIDYITFEVACRVEILAGEVCRSYLPVSGLASEWLAKGRSLIESFEKSVSGSGRIDFGALDARRYTEDVEARVRVGWQAVLVARQLAFEGPYRGTLGRCAYDLLTALYCLRALQRYRSLVTPAHGPMGALWIQVLFERSVASAAMLMPTHGTLAK